MSKTKKPNADATPEAPRSSEIMTFGELLLKRPHSTGTCRFCSQWNVSGRWYSVRHFVCMQCCMERQDEMLPSVARAQAKARHYVKILIKENRSSHAGFISHLCRVSERYAQWLLDQQKRA